MASAYAQCTRCGLEFESEAIKPGGASRGTTIRGFIEQCPRCGSAARTMEGTFDYYGDELLMVSGPAWTREMLGRIRAQLGDIERVAASKKYTDEEARQRVEKILAEIERSNPVVAHEYRRRVDPGDRKTWARSAKAVAVGVLAVIGGIETVAAFAERVAQAWEVFRG